MSGDALSQSLFQQLHSRNVTGEHLEVLGKQAAARWHAGEFDSLTEAVVSMVKSAHLSPEQVKRVIEFTNTAAYLDEFKKEGATHRVIEFSGGPADPSEILKDLNDGGGGTVFDAGTSDYHSPPKEASEKTASVHDESALSELFSGPPVESIPYENPHAEVIDLKDKLAAAADHLQSEISGLEIVFGELGARVYHQVKQAALEGYPLGHILQAWQEVSPDDDYIKVAFELITPRLLHEGVFHTLEQMENSVDKVAESRVANTVHPLVQDFSEFCQSLTVLAEKRAAREEVLFHHEHLTNYLKTASTVGDIYRAANRGAGRAAGAVTPFVSKHLGETAGKVVGTTVNWSPQLALAAAANEAHTHYENDPSLQPLHKVVDAGLQQIPGTSANVRHKMGLQYGQS